MSAQRFEVDSDRGSCLLFEAEWESLGPDSRVNFAESCKQLGVNRERDHQEEDHMKCMYILGFFFSVLLFSYQPAQAMPTFGPTFAKVDGVVVKAYTYRRARVTTRRTARRVYRRNTYGYPY